MKQPVYVTEDDGTLRQIGYIVEMKGRRAFFSRRRSSRHFYRRLNGWGIDKEIFEKELLPKVRLLVILDEDTQMLYVTTPQTFVQKGQTIHYYPYRAQIVLPIDFWRIRRAGTRH